jgi:hypothetical protein
MESQNLGESLRRGQRCEGETATAINCKRNEKASGDLENVEGHGRLAAQVVLYDIWLFKDRGAPV